ncbi:hypothetical protein F503_01457 [Ophiostoma piceae UAMH 11346]|uniref:Uncharacterized protein n=1 Tax=Ophiostoma piceae (strain UAMH 11346) TaxID=1262450 RepID=S3BUL5_OPHP1|nr:hypothetical protein F503_01457 [Ophiostoma piceae UAMH 11346]
MEAHANTLGYRVNSTMYAGQWNAAQSDFSTGYKPNGYEAARDTPPYRSTSRSQNAPYPRGSGPASPFNAPSLANGLSNVDTSFQHHGSQISPQYTQSPPPFYKWEPPATSAAPSYGPIGSSVRQYNTANDLNGRSGQGAFAMDDDAGARHSLSHPVSPGGGAEFSGGVSINALGMSRQSFSPVGSGDEMRDGSMHSDDSSGQDQMVPSPPSLSMSLSSTERGSNGFPHPGAMDGSSLYTGNNGSGMLPTGAGVGRTDGRSRPGRRGANRDEFDGPHQFLPRPTPSYIAMQERELPHLPTNLLVQEQDNVLSQVNDRLSQCAFDFVARYQFPVPLTQDMRPVARPQDREWTEWVQLLKRLATKRRIPARVLYNGQIKQFVTILENSLEMRHAARHQSRPLKDDRNILQLISAGIQVAKILKDAPAMDFLDRLYVVTEKQIQERSSSAGARFRSGI